MWTKPEKWSWLLKLNQEKFYAFSRGPLECLPRILPADMRKDHMEKSRVGLSVGAEPTLQVSLAQASKQEDVSRWS